MTKFTPITITSIKNEEVRKFANLHDKDNNGKIDSNELKFLREHLVMELLDKDELAIGTDQDPDAPYTLNDCKEILGWNKSKNNMQYNIKIESEYFDHEYYSKENTIKQTERDKKGKLISEQIFTYNDKENTITYNSNDYEGKKYGSKYYYDDSGKIYKELVDENGDGKYDKTILKNYIRQKINEWFGF